MPWWLIIVIVVVGGFVAMFILGSIITANKKKHATAKIMEAKKVFNGGNHYKALELIGDAFYVPMNEKYSTEDAKTASEVLTFLEEVLEKHKMRSIPQIAEVKKRLALAARGDDVRVPDSLTDPVEEFLEKLCDDSGETDAPFFSVDTDEPDTLLNDLTDEQSSIINAIGRKLIFGNKDEIITETSKHLVGATGQFRVDLLNQRGSVYFMQEDYQKAAADYKEAAELSPAHATNWSNLAEAYEKLLDGENAVKAATKILTLDYADKDARKIAKNILAKFG